MDFRRLKAQRQAELDETLLRSLAAERTRFQSKLKTLLYEIEGIQKIIAEYQAQIRDLEPAIDELRQAMGDLDLQEQEILADQARWQSQLAG